MSTIQASPDQCPAFPPDEQLPALHHWTPLAPLSAPYGPVVDHKAIKVIEVCPSCHQYRITAYEPVPRDSDGVH